MSKRRRTDDLPAMPAPHLVGLRSIGGPGRPRQLFLEKAAGTSRGIEKQHASGFATGRSHQPYPGPGSLAGSYGGSTASAAVGAEVGANALVGGFSRSFTLQPVSVEGQTGFDVDGGLATVDLQYAPNDHWPSRCGRRFTPLSTTCWRRARRRGKATRCACWRLPPAA